MLGSVYAEHTLQNVMILGMTPLEKSEISPSAEFSLQVVNDLIVKTLTATPRAVSHDSSTSSL